MVKICITVDTVSSKELFVLWLNAENEQTHYVRQGKGLPSFSSLQIPLYKIKQILHEADVH